MKNNALLPGFSALFLGAIVLTGVFLPEVSIAEISRDPVLEDAVPEAMVCPIESFDALTELVAFVQGDGTPINSCPDKPVESKTKCDKIALNENIEQLERRLCKSAKEMLIGCAEEAGPCIKCKRGENLPSSPNATCKSKGERPASVCGPLTLVEAEDGSKQFCVTASGNCEYKCSDTP